DQPAPSPTSRSRERGGQRRVSPEATGRRSVLARTNADELVEPERLEVLIDDLLERRQRDPRLPLLVLVDEPVEEHGQLLTMAEAETRLLDRLGAAATVEIDRRKPAGQRLDESVRVGVVL